MNRVKEATNETFKQAALLLRRGELVSFPTETVYGLGADAENNIAVAKIYSAKNRPSFNPLIVHLADVNLVSKYVQINELSKKLAKAFWPGPFTMVLPLNEDSNLSELITAGLDTVAIRVPENNTAHSLLDQFNGPIAAPSANKSGHISPTTAQHVDGEFGAELSMIIDGGPCEKGIESTIVEIKDNQVILLRPGNVTEDDIKEITGITVRTHRENTKAPNAPGQLKSHYAPETSMRLNVTSPNKNEGYLAFGPSPVGENILNLSPTGDLTEAAANLFSMMRKLDQLKLSAIAVAPIPQTGLGRAINDRLKRAAAPKDKA